MKSQTDPCSHDRAARDVPTDRAAQTDPDADLTPGAKHRTSTTVPCFAPGTRLMTDAGLKPIENLTPGDLVLTRHHGYCPLSWVGQRHLEEGALGAALRPIVLHPGSLAPARPARTLIVSPKLQVSMPSAADQGPDIKCRAQDLMGRPGVERVAPGDTIYIMIALEVPDMVQAEGIWCAAADGTATPEALFLFPELQTAEPA